MQADGMGVAGVAISLRTPRSNLLLPWLILALGIPASVLLSTVIRDGIEDAARLRFERQARDALAVIDERIQFYSDILYGLRALFASQGPVSRLQFHRFVQSLDLKNRFPGFDVVNYAVYVAGKDKERFVESVRRDTSLDPRGYPSFTIRPPGERSEYYVLAYVEPMAGFEFAFGRDLGANPDAAESEPLLVALRSARDSGKLTASGVPLRIKSRAKEYVGLAMRLAVYRSGMPANTIAERRAAYLGSVGAGFNVEDLMRGVLDSDTGGRIEFKLYDARSAADRPLLTTSTGGRRLLFDSKQLVRTGALPSASESIGVTFDRILTTEVGGRIWEIHFSAPAHAVIGRVDAFLPWLVLTGGALSSALLFGMFYSMASSRRRALELANEMTKDLRQSEQELRHSAEQLQALSRRLVDVQESERRQFSRELHDRVGQNLTALSINLDILRTQLQGDANQGLRLRLDDAATLLEATSGSIENVMSELRPPMLDDYGLLPALQWYASEFSRRMGIEVTVDGDQGMQRLSQAGEIALFRIAQEALNNVAKHAHARSVHITLEHSGPEIVMAVSDDGVGLDVGSGSTSRRRPGLGMVTMRERTQAVGGSFQIGAGPGRGTRVTVRVPLSDGDQSPHRG